MAIRNVILEGDNILRKPARKVENINERIHTLFDDMAQTMYESNGVGLAAPQVGVLRQVIVIDIGEGLIELVNPEIIEQSGVQKGEEGCLSLPGVVAIVERPEKVTVKGLNRQGEEVIHEAEGFLARAFCHEIDHLSGIIFLDHPHEIVDLTQEEEEE